MPAAAPPSSPLFSVRRFAPGSRAITYDAPPTVARFMRDEHRIRFLLGPVGSGKTTGVLFEVIRRACEQAPNPIDGVRRTRFAIVRNTLAQIKQTVMRDAQTWLGDAIHHRVADNVLEFRVGDVFSEWFMIPLETSEDKARLLSMQLTGVWVNEFIEIDPALIGDMRARCGRYPLPEEGGCTWRGVVGDSNMPTRGSPWYEFLETRRQNQVAVFIQPGGLEPNAENLDFLNQTPETLRLPVGHPERRAQGRRYYLEQLENRDSSWVQRYIHAQYGDDPEGAAVFASTFNQKFHVFTLERVVNDIEQLRKETGAEISAPKHALSPVQGSPLIVGQDFGRNPCSVIGQIDPTGAVNVLAELIAENTALETHLLSALLPLLKSERFNGLPVVVVGDPSGVAAGVTTEASCFDVLARHGLPATPAPTNVLDVRLRAVERLLMQNVMGRPMLRIDGDNCPKLVAALNGFYRFKRKRDGTANLAPEKTHPWSDVADAFQYLCLATLPSFQPALARTITRSTHRNVLVTPIPYGASIKRAPPDVRGWT